MIGSLWAIDFNHIGREQLGAAIRAAVGRAMEPEMAKPDAALDAVQVQSGVGLVKLKGVMLKGLGDLGPVVSDTARVRRQIESASRDSTVSQIMLVIDSPGGSVDGLAELGDAISAARERKPVIAQVDGTAASAAFYAAARATRITLGRQDMVGSIGVRMQMFDLSKMFEQVGVRSVLVDTGEFKSIGAVGEPITESQQAEVQRLVDTFFADFKRIVEEGRGMSPAQVEEVADGRVFVGEQAVRLGLADAVSDFDRTFVGMRDQIERDREARRIRSRATMVTT